MKVAVTMLVAVLLTGCGRGEGAAGGEDGRTAAGEWPTTERGGLVEGRVLPLEKYLVSYPDFVVAENARITAVDDCMKRYGFRYDLPPLGDFPPPSVNSANMERRYGISDRTVAEKYAYRLPEAVAADPGDYQLPGGEAASVVLRGPDADVRQGARGSIPGDLPQGGCSGQAEKLLGRLDDQLASDLGMESQKKSEDDRTVREAISAWSDCMAGHGYQAEHPHDAYEIVPASSREVSPQEIAVAVADIGCKAETDLIAIWFEVETRIQNNLIEENALALEEQRAANERVLEQAARS